MSQLSIKELINMVHQNAVDHGWHDEPKSFGEVIALIHSELSEALEFEREKNNPHYMDGRIDYMHHYSGGGYISDKPMNKTVKPDGLLVELADVVIRVFDYVGSKGLSESFESIIQEKHQYNKTRPYRHGGKTI